MRFPRFRPALRAASLLLVAAASTRAQSTGPPDRTLYYVSSTGDDDNTGMGPLRAWRTIARVNQQVLEPGDVVLFQGGVLFPGTITLTAPESGTPERPILFRSYGGGQAILWANTGTGFDLVDVSGIEIKNLVVGGSGINTNSGIGISFYTELPGDVKLPWIRITDTRVTGFRRGGISIGAYNGSTGFQDVRVERCTLDHNGNNGMATWGFYDPLRPQTVDAYPHRSLYVGHCTFASNWGDPTLTTKHTGSGIEVAQCAGAVLEYNHAYDNGRLNSYPNGGPIGIWLWDTRDGVIQFNESHDNMSGTLDGGGFDLDGGCVSCVMQYNYSHDNEGAGLLVGQFAGSPPTSDLTVRYNVSERDGGRGGASSLQLWNGDATQPIEAALFHNNTVFVGTKSIGISRGVRAFGNGDADSALFSNNILYAQGAGAWLVDLFMTPAPLMVGNLYFASGPFVVRQGSTNYSDLAGWRLVTSQELLPTGPTGLQADPLLVAPGGGGTIGDPNLLFTLGAYRLQPLSPARDLGLPLPVFGIAVGPHDFYGAPVPTGVGYSIGADEGL